MTEAEAQILAEGARAQEALDYLAPVFHHLRAKAFDRMMQTGPEHTALREKLFFYMKALGEAEGTIKDLIGQAEATRIMDAHPNMQVMAGNALGSSGLTRP